MLPSPKYLQSLDIAKAFWILWIAVNTEYLSMDGTSTVEVVVATATAAANGQNVGDISIIIPEGLAIALQSSAEAAADACSAVLLHDRDNDNRKRVTEAALTCAADYALAYAANGGVIDSFISVDALIDADLKVVTDASAALLNIIRGLSVAQVKKIILWLAVFDVVLTVYSNNVLSGVWPTLQLIGKINIPGGGFGEPEPKPKCTGLEVVNIDSLLCREYECQGGNLGKCTIPPNELCPCIITAKQPSPPQPNIANNRIQYQQERLSLVSKSIQSPGGPCVAIGGAFPNNLVLRILPLGASIVFGTDSSDGNGFRKDLRNQLIANNASVNYVGEVQAGNMLDNDVSGFAGLRIEQVAPKMENALPWLPNLIIIHVGTNDALQNYQVSTAQDRLGAMIDRINSALPHTVVLVSTLIPNLNAAAEANIQTINAALPAMVKQRTDAGALVYLADMHNGYITDADLTQSDGTHPNNAGYVKMANVWYSAIQEIYAKCWFTPPGFVASVNDSVGTGVVDTTCEKVSGWSIVPYQTQRGSGNDDGVYLHEANALGQANIDIPNKATDFSILGVYWADINGYSTKGLIGIDDFVYLYHNSQALGVALNDGTGVNGFGGTGGYLQYAIGMSCGASATWFGDIDGEVSLGALFTPPKITGTQGYTTILGDIDGDGKVDYLYVGHDGSLTAWRNGGVGVPTVWQPLGVVFNDSRGLMWTQFRLADVNGDGRDDIVWVDNTGAVTTWTNLRGETINSLAPFWKYAGVTHSGAGVGVTQYRQVSFANVAGHKEWITYPDYFGVGDDYMALFTGNGGSNPLPSGETSLNNENLAVKLYFNTGKGGGTRQKGDGDRYCDMRGIGADDYIWMDKDGTLTLYGNYNSAPLWLQYGEIYTPENLMIGHTRKDLFLADLDGDGKCDFLIVDKVSGSIHMIRNDYSPTTDKFAWTDMGIIFNGGGCPNHHGVGLFDLGVRFADVTGNGFPDYLCIDPDGRTTAWKNTNMVFESMGQIKHSEGADRADIRFVDINGDGRADYLWVDKFAGTYQVWTNEGPGDPAVNGGSYIHWIGRGVSGGGTSLRGECINWSDLNGDGRADYTVVYPQTSVAYVYPNVCPDNISGPPMTILPPLPGDPYLKRSVENGSRYPRPGQLPPRRALISLDSSFEG
ncbi:carbohydrate esterase family 3 protein [Oidiodendron maius Zn]|uniref:Carbohydrate esterase family 3 protein n=1 Tax=Oidiodendron maius (strain Zn) TaxID=913774 RepID=A0A0C3DFP2_OIDMZ|nr:carbohydrate esterase family 3 protein [Oidiodendron maius Zn]